MFDAGDLDVELNNENFLNRFEDVAKGAYVVNKNKLIKFHGENCPLLECYLELFNKRIKSQFRERRETVVIELKDLRTKGLSYKGQDVISEGQKSTLCVTLTLDKIGVGCLTYWLKIPAPMSIKIARVLRDLSNLKTIVTIDVLNYTGELSFYDIVELLICVLFKRIYPDKLQAVDICKGLLEGKRVSSLHAEICKLLDSKSEIYREIVPYPVYFIETPMKTRDLHAFREKNARKIRAILTGDIHWQRKKTEIVRRQVVELDKSSADSVIWLTDTDGTVKLFSTDFETDRLMSKVLTIFELEILLTQKFFLHTVNYNLSKVTEKEWTPKRLSEFREDVIEKLDKYYNIDISQKDTTRYRIEDFKDILHINYLYEIAMAKFEGLSKRIEAYYETASWNRDFMLALILGVFGVGAFVHTLSMQVLKAENYSIVVYLTLVSMVITFIFLYILLGGRLRRD
jgi:hypothetical protein